MPIELINACPRYTCRPCFLRMWRNWQTRQLEVLVGQPMEVRVLSCALTVADPATVFLFSSAASRAAGNQVRRPALTT
jgi:hypothetical protein